MTGDEPRCEVKRIRQEIINRYLLPGQIMVWKPLDVDFLILWDAKAVYGVVKERAGLVRLGWMHGSHLFPLFVLQGVPETLRIPLVLLVDASDQAYTFVGVDKTVWRVPRNRQVPKFENLWRTAPKD